jgi:ubiquinone/menaquinone biosynthesis C-methylase UbiE
MISAQKMPEKELSLGAEEARIREAYARRALSGKHYSRFDAGYLFMIQELERRLLAALRRRGLTPLGSKRILEIGCGNGHWLREFIKWGASPDDVAGIDLLAERIAQARRLSPPAVALSQGNAARLEFANGSFDIVFQATVFTSILNDKLRQQVAAEMIRVLKPGGVALWYDFRVNNPQNPDVRGIGKAEIEKLFSGCAVALETITLAPPLARALAPYSWVGAQLLGSIPWARTHYLGTIEKPG